MAAKAELRGAVLYRDGYLCQICESAPATEVDHIWPVAFGGTDSFLNLRASCRSCNAAKGDTLYYRFFTASRAHAAAEYFRRKAEEAIYQAAIWRGICETLSEPSETLVGEELAEAAAIENTKPRPDWLLDVLAQLRANLTWDFSGAVP